MDLLPLPLLSKLRKALARPVTEVALEKASVSSDSEPQCLGDWGGGLSRPLEGRCVDSGGCCGQAGDASCSGCRLLAALLREVKARSATRKHLPRRRCGSMPYKEDKAVSVR